MQHITIFYLCNIRDIMRHSRKWAAQLTYMQQVGKRPKQGFRGIADARKLILGRRYNRQKKARHRILRKAQKRRLKMILQEAPPKAGEKPRHQQIKRREVCRGRVGWSRFFGGWGRILPGWGRFSAIERRREPRIYSMKPHAPGAGIGPNGAGLGYRRGVLG